MHDFMKKYGKNINVPNGLTVLRILLIPVFTVLYLQGHIIPAFIVLALSALTDLLDGIIARHFHQVTDLGKLLDPVADKLTQVAIALCLSFYNSRIIPFLIILVVKEFLMMLGSAKLLHSGKRPTQAMWYGKVATASFYLIMAIIVIFGDRLPVVWQYILIAICAAFMVNAFVRYTQLFRKITKEDESAGQNSAE